VWVTGGGGQCGGVIPSTGWGPEQQQQQQQQPLRGQECRHVEQQLEGVGLEDSSILLAELGRQRPADQQGKVT
jgi:hypothetical protein